MKNVCRGRLFLVLGSLGPRQGLNRVAQRRKGPAPRGAEATLGATASPLGQRPSA